MYVILLKKLYEMDFTEPTYFLRYSLWILAMLYYLAIFQEAHY